MIDIVVPFWNGNTTINELLDSIPQDTRVILVQDADSEDFKGTPLSNVLVKKLDKRGYFAGACNFGMTYSDNDVLILNQDSILSDGWRHFVEENRGKHDIIGDGVFGHPAWPNGYAQGTFMYISRAVIDAIGLFNEEIYPLWGCTCEYQLRACRAGFSALPCNDVPGYTHQERPRGKFGTAITEALKDEPEKKRTFITTPPEISVIIPCYNYGHFLQECVTSVLEQSFQSTEVIVVDDCSTDDSFSMALKLANDWKGVKAFRTPRNLGTAGSLNYGIQRAHGKYIAILSADDTMRSDRLEKMHGVITAQPDKAFVYDDVLITKADGRSNPWVMGEWDLPALIKRNSIHAGLLYPRAAWVEAGGYPEAMRDGREDWAFNVALGLAGWRGVHIPEPMYIYRRHSANRTLRNTNPRNIAAFREKILALFPAARDLAYPSSLLVKYTGQSWGRQTFFGLDGAKYNFWRGKGATTVSARDAGMLLKLSDERGRPIFEEVK